jgi:hypothetical protein
MLITPSGSLIAEIGDAVGSVERAIKPTPPATPSPLSEEGCGLYFEFRGVPDFELAFGR